MIEAAYRYARHEPGVDVVLFGTGDAAHLRANVASLLKPPLPEADRAKLAKLFGHLAGIGLDSHQGPRLGAEAQMKRVRWHRRLLTLTPKRVGTLRPPDLLTRGRPQGDVCQHVNSWRFLPFAALLTATAFAQPALRRRLGNLRQGRGRRGDRRLHARDQVRHLQRQDPGAGLFQPRRRVEGQGRHRQGGRRLRRGDQERSASSRRPTTIAASPMRRRPTTTRPSPTMTRRSSSIRPTPRR